jgi:hypothetical protein
MKVTGITVIFTYENGEVQDVSKYLPRNVDADLEDFADCWEDEQTEDEE